MAGSSLKKTDIIAVDFGGTNLRVALVRKNRIIKIIKNKTPKTKKGIIDLMHSSIKSLVDEFGKSKIKGIGIASPGPLQNGILINPPNIPFRDFNLKKSIYDKFKIKTYVENDANCVAISESKLGVKKKNFIVLTIGTGIGGGIIINGELYKGQGLGGELGHIFLSKNKDFENLASGTNLKRVTRRKFGKEHVIDDLLKRRDKKSKLIVEDEVEFLAQGIGSLINVFDPEVVVLNGGMRESGEALLKKISGKLPKYQIIKRKVPIRWAKLKHPGLIGASLLVK